MEPNFYVRWVMVISPKGKKKMVKEIILTETGKIKTGRNTSKEDVSTRIACTDDDQLLSIKGDVMKAQVLVSVGRRYQMSALRS